ncbi:MAG: Hpt domain-containing protein [Bacteroidetes bacterium]|nr:Hpt domain-containing protein [Bacteroidota bacterium]MBL6943280.1 Hpt domain-containing protein [Bacteroidales bacterium]
MPTKQPFKLNKLSQYFGNDTTQIREMLTLFIDTVPPDIMQLQELAYKEQWEEILKITHRIKPSLDVFEMNDILEDVRKIEDIVRLNNKEENLNNYLIKLVDNVNKMKLLFLSEIKKY